MSIFISYLFSLALCVGLAIGLFFSLKLVQLI